ncbi:MAG TPA: translocation/assembly module TamB domain-containing protein, partial [Burkholderiales bacterium]
TALNLEARALNLRALYSTLRETELAGPLDIRLTETQQYLKGALRQNNFSISVDAMREGHRVDVRTLQASASGGEIRGSGHVELEGAMPFAADLRFRRFDPAQFGDYPGGRVNGSIEAKGQLEEHSRLVHAQWIIDDSRLSDQPLASRGRARIEAERVSEVEAQARWGVANMNANGAFGRRGDVLRWRLDAPQLAKLDKRLDGSVKGNGTLTGVWTDPRANFDLGAAALHLPGDIAIGTLKASGAAGKTPKSPLQLDLVATKLAAGDIKVARLAADIDGSVERHKAVLAIAAQDVDLNARLAGGWTAAQGWVGTIDDLRNRGRYPLELVAAAPLRVTPQRVALGRLEAKFAEGGILIREATWANKRLQTNGEFTRLPAAWLIVAAGLRDQLQSTLLLNAEWSIAADPQLNGTLSLSRAAGDITLLSAPAIALGLEQFGVQAKFVNDDVRAALDLRSAIANAAINARLQPVATANGPQLNVDSPLTLDAKVDVASLRPFSVLFDTTGRVDGRLQADLRGSGTLKSPDLHGSINGENLAFDVPPYGMYLEKGRLRAQLEGEVLNVQEFVLHGGDGRFLMNGRVPLRMTGGGTDLNWRAERFAVMNRPDMRLVVTGDGNVRFADKKIALVGQLQADRGYFEVGDNQLPELSDDVVIVGEQRKVVQKPGEKQFPIQLDVRLNLGNDLRLFAYGYQGYLGGRLRLYTNTNGLLRAEGRINTDRGRFTAYGKRLEVEKGVITFDGPIDNPTLQVEAWQRNQAVEVGVKISGSVQSPQVQLASEPPVSEGEKLSWLVLGRAPGDAQGADLALLQAAAGTLFSRGDAVGVNQRIAQQLGLDDVSFRGSGQLTGNVVALGKRFSDKIYVTFEQGIGLAQSLVKLDYSLSRRWSARLETGNVSGIGLFYRIAFD